MNKLKTFFFALSVLFTVFNTQAQMKKNIDYSGFFDTYYTPDLWSFNAGVGFPLYYGDLCGGLGCNSNMTLSYVAGVGYKPWPKVMFGGDFYYTTLSAKDVDASRNISFVSKNMELALYGRYYLKEDIIRRHSDMFKRTKLVKPYVMIGFSGLYFNPQAVSSNAVTGIVSPVNEGVTYPKLGMAIPAGIGASFDLSRRVSILTEVIYRYTFTDLLDGVSTVNGNPGAKDSYLTLDLKIQWTPWAPRSKKKKQRPPKNVPDYSSDSTAASSGAGDSTVVQEKDPEMDYYDQLLQEEKEKDKAPASDEEYLDIINEEDSESDSGAENYDDEGYLIEEKEESEDDSSYDANW